MKSKYTINDSPVYVSDYLTAKMSGVPAISTSCLKNPICYARRKVKGSICEKCFAASTLSRYSECERHAAENFDLLTGRLLNADELPIFGNVRFVRIEAFGDVANVTQARNYVRIIRANPDVVFGWFTKNAYIVQGALKLEGGKPENLVLIQSSMMMNTPAPIVSGFDRVFTVYDKAHAGAVNINCGARSCVGCGRCYKHGGESVVSELLK